MITRIVKLHFKAEHVQDFLNHFDDIKDRLRNQPGCLELNLFQDSQNPNVYFTISKWEHEKDLEHYRTSEFFKEVWYFTKSFFEHKADAWTLKGV